MNGRQRHARIHRLVTGAISLLLASALLAPPANAAPTWLPVTDLSTVGQSGHVPQVAVDHSGNAFAVWQQTIGADDIIQAATRPAGGSWSSPVDLSVTGQDARTPQIAVDGAGNATAVWQRSNGTHSIIQAATRPSGGAWSGVIDLSGAGGNAYLAQIAINANGTTTAVWYRNNGTNDFIQAATRPVGGTWSAPATLSEAGQNGYGPDVVLDSVGNVTVVWRGYNGPYLAIKAATRPAGGAWSAPSTLSAGGQSALSPQVALDAGGNATVVWHRWNGFHYIVQAASRAVGGTWSAPSDLTAPGQSAHDPQIAVDEAGNAIAVWYRSNGTHNIIQTATRPVGGTWSASVSLSAPGQDARDPQITLDALGNATTVWRRSDGTHTIIQTTTRPAGGAWSSTTDLSGAGQDAYAAQVAHDTDGNATVVWSRDDATYSIVQARGLDAAGPIMSAFSVPATGTAGTAVAVSATLADVWSAIAGATWTFGDGATATGTSAGHTWTTPGSYTVTLTATDAVGNTTIRTSPITISAAPKVARITRFKLKPAKIRAVGSDSTVRARTKAIIKLTAAAKVKLTFKKKGTKKIAAKLSKRISAGTAKLKLTAKIGKKKLKPGTYNVILLAVFADGTRSKRTARLKVVR